jgi:hypothetical protein
MRYNEMTPAEQGIDAARADAKHEGAIRAYYHLKEAWYAEAILKDRDFVDEVMFGYYHPYGGGTSGEIAMRWMDLGGHVSPQLQCFNDAWSALAHMQDVIDALAKLDGVDITATRFCQLLDECGFKDMTLREQK